MTQKYEVEILRFILAIAFFKNIVRTQKFLQISLLSDCLILAGLLADYYLIKMFEKVEYRTKTYKKFKKQISCPFRI
jgi:hypothetical protein